MVSGTGGQSAKIIYVSHTEICPMMCNVFVDFYFLFLGVEFKNYIKKIYIKKSTE